MSKSKTDGNETQFTCHAPDAKEVFLAGTFNEWKCDATPMSKDGAGKWTAKLELPAGRYEFKFVVDGQWCCETNCHAEGECPQCVPNDMGTMNRVCEVQ
ncbi:glycogen-binding domain-containing protein [Stieleria sp. ICT_E10.1]|uniref:glycogen-binding domain-containing protein n=1 Tax=Stieleria sedimenti TaxID=2976331 RepID=UPI00217FCA74|nr:glycogen-binding domain-containing protein [Stieleria sedimenti]MCS7466366.1 glycogen-binding domain-containing protein [Stieleria sedimenti]